jgi:hypothetical protein
MLYVACCDEKISAAQNSELIPSYITLRGDVLRLGIQIMPGTFSSFQIPVGNLGTPILLTHLSGVIYLSISSSEEVERFSQ